MRLSNLVSHQTINQKKLATICYWPKTFILKKVGHYRCNKTVQLTSTTRHTEISGTPLVQGPQIFPYCLVHFSRGVPDTSGRCVPGIRKLQGLYITYRKVRGQFCFEDYELYSRYRELVFYQLHLLTLQICRLKVRVCYFSNLNYTIKLVHDGYVRNNSQYKTESSKKLFQVQLSYSYRELTVQSEVTVH